MPDEKNPGDNLKDFKDKFSKMAFGRTLSDSQKKEICVFCGASCKPEDFKDALSVKEYQITGICQKCQDKTFGEEDDSGEYEEDSE